MPNSREKGYTSDATGATEKDKCGEEYLELTIPKIYSNSWYTIYFPQPSDKDLRVYLEGRNKSEDEIEQMVKEYCNLRENPGGSNPFVKWCMENGIDIDWIFRDFKYVFLHLQSTMPDNTVKERTRTFEEFVVQRGPFGNEGVGAATWLIQKKLFAGHEPKDFIPDREQMEECEEIIKNSLMSRPLDEIVKKRDEFREAAEDFTATHTAEEWLEKNNMPSKVCMCDCTLPEPMHDGVVKVGYYHGRGQGGRRGLRHRNKRSAGNSGGMGEFPPTLTTPEETTQGPTTADKIIAGTLGATAITGTVATVLGTGATTSTAGAIGAASTGALGGNATAAAAVGAAAASTATSLSGAICTGLLCTAFSAGVLGVIYNYCYTGDPGRNSGNTNDGLGDGVDGEPSNVVVTQPGGDRESVRGALGRSGGSRNPDTRGSGKSSSKSGNLEHIR